MPDQYLPLIKSHLAREPGLAAMWLRKALEAWLARKGYPRGRRGTLALLGPATRDGVLSSEEARVFGRLYRSLSPLCHWTAELQTLGADQLSADLQQARRLIGKPIRARHQGASGMRGDDLLHLASAHLMDERVDACLYYARLYAERQLKLGLDGAPGLLAPKTDATQAETLQILTARAVKEGALTPRRQARLENLQEYANRALHHGGATGPSRSDAQTALSILDADFDDPEDAFGCPLASQLLQAAELGRDHFERAVEARPDLGPFDLEGEFLAAARHVMADGRDTTLGSSRYDGEVARFHRRLVITLAAREG